MIFVFIETGSGKEEEEKKREDKKESRGYIILVAPAATEDLEPSNLQDNRSPV